MKDKENKEIKEKDDTTLGDKIEDFLDTTQDLLLGERHSIQEDIPATIQTDSGRRIILKSQTRKNINKKIFSKKITWKIILIVIGCMVGISVLVGIIIFIGTLLS